MGIKQNGDYDVLFEKQYFLGKATQPMEPILNDIKCSLVKLNERYDYLCKLTNCYNKKRDVIYHNIENFEDDVSDEAMINACLQLKEVGKVRREAKNEHTLIHILRTLGFNDKVNEMINNVLKSDEKLKTKSEQCKTQNPPNNIVIEMPYSDHKQRIKLTAEMQKKYDKVGYDDNRKVVMGYNKMYAN